MNNNFEVVENAPDFLTNFFGSEEGTVNTPQNTSTTEPTPVQNFLNPKPTETPLEENKPSEEGAEKVDEFLKDKPEEVVDDKFFVKDVTKFSEILKEKSILEPYEDGSLPSTEEEFIDALSQSVSYKAQTAIEQAWKEKIEALPLSLQKIHHYAEIGVTNAQQLAQYTNAVAQTEAISQLNLKTPEDQEQVVLIHLMNTGMPEKDARDEVADLKERNKLEARATQYFPNLKRAYEENERQQLIEKEQTEQNIVSYVQNNATNAMYFLEKDTEYLPFKLAPNDKNYKQDILNLAGQAVDRNEDGSPVFGWQRYIESLQFGDEASYKKYMKIMAYAANQEKFEEKMGTKVSSQTSGTNFKKIKTAQGIQASTTTSESVPQVVKKQSGPWAVR